MIASRQCQGTSAYGNSYLSCEAAAELIPVFTLRPSTWATSNQEFVVGDSLRSLFRSTPSW